MGVSDGAKGDHNRAVADYGEATPPIDCPI